MEEVTLRYARKHDLPQVLELIKELASYERAPDEVTVTLEELEQDGFGEKPLYEVILAEINGQTAGMALYFIAYSTWKGKCVYLEDIIVKKDFRRRGIGTKLFDAVIGKARELNARRLMWQVLRWNEPAINFYKKYHAVLDAEWINGRLTREQLETFQPETPQTKGL